MDSRRRSAVLVGVFYIVATVVVLAVWLFAKGFARPLTAADMAPAVPGAVQDESAGLA